MIFHQISWNSLLIVFVWLFTLTRRKLDKYWSLLTAAFLISKPSNLVSCLNRIFLTRSPLKKALWTGKKVASWVPNVDSSGLSWSNAFPFSSSVRIPSLLRFTVAVTMCCSLISAFLAVVFSMEILTWKNNSVVRSELMRDAWWT